MKKSDLIPMKDYVKTRNGDVCCFSGNELIDLHAYVPMKDYNEELISIDGKSEWDIMAIYRTTSILNLGHIDKHILYNLESIKNGEINPIWERYEKPKLSHDEYIILRNIDKKYKFIYRGEKDKDLFCSNTQPPTKYKQEDWYRSFIKTISISSFCHLFQFVKKENEDRYYIPDLLKEYESYNNKKQEE